MPTEILLFYQGIHLQKAGTVPPKVLSELYNFLVFIFRYWLTWRNIWFSIPKAISTKPRFQQFEHLSTSNLDLKNNLNLFCVIWTRKNEESMSSQSDFVYFVCHWFWLKVEINHMVYLICPLGFLEAGALLGSRWIKKRGEIHSFCWRVSMGEVFWRIFIWRSPN